MSNTFKPVKIQYSSLRAFNFQISAKLKPRLPRSSGSDAKSALMVQFEAPPHSLMNDYPNLQDGMLNRPLMLQICSPIGLFFVCLNTQMNMKHQRSKVTQSALQVDSFVYMVTCTVLTVLLTAYWHINHKVQHTHFPRFFPFL